MKTSVQEKEKCVCVCVCVGGGAEGLCLIRPTDRTAVCVAMHVGRGWVVMDGLQNALLATGHQNNTHTHTQQICIQQLISLRTHGPAPPVTTRVIIPDISSWILN